MALVVESCAHANLHFGCLSSLGAGLIRKVATLITVILMLILLVLFAGQWLQRSLVAAGIEQLEWQQLRWREGSLQLDQISAVYVSEQGRVGIRGQGVSLKPVWRGGPRAEQLLVEELQLVWQPAENLPPPAAEQPWILPSLTEFAQPLGWLPQQLRVGQLRVHLPCAEAFCDLMGSLQVDSQPQPLALNARVELQAQGQTVTGELQLQEQPDRYLLQAAVQIPEPLPLPGLGQLSGSLELDLQNSGELWMLHQGQASGRLEQPQLDALAALPEGWRPTALALHITPQPGNLAQWQDSLMLALRLETEGAIAGQMEGQLALTRQPRWAAQLSEARLQLSAERLGLSAVELEGVTLDWPLQAVADAQQMVIGLGDRAPLSIRRLALADQSLTLQGVQAQLGSARLVLPLETPQLLTLTSPLQLGVQQLHQASLKPQGWNLQGDVQYSASGLRIDGNLAALSGLNSGLRLDWPAAEDWQLRLSFGDIFLRAANPLAATFTDWPALLSFSSGRVTGQLQASGSDSLRRLTGQLSLSGGEGIYDRASFSGLSLPLSVSLQRDELRLSTDGLAVKSLDPGLVLGPLQARGSYAAALEHLAEGVLELQQASLGVLEGQVKLEPTSVSLAQPRQSMVAIVEGVELARLFEVYPAEGLSGRGTLDGRFPVSLVNGKLLVEDGQLQARQPGGVLRYQTPQLRELATSNPNLEQLAAALDDFRYRVLASEVSYDDQGVLVLGLRLEGSNPSFQQGRQVNLNIRLEEDIPALLTSLQLSGQVSDIIRRRIEQRYLQPSSP